ncbi:MBOAT family protein [Porphyromonas sp. oral taxon 275]|uniref:MBOAT family O-acyltransferase n=1 Tax=Porphyromonas sp. oral taxon 275 TaxID=712435 RepID=UPI001BA98465|nr:MBOAT family protein [Porphyromonas sp. oral taxon 275]QUB43590.1 MBOAT family protein [Porphyromonas sp. oral taxon 275]
MDYIDSIDWGRLPEVLRFSKSSPMIFSSGLFLFCALFFLPIYMMLRRTTTLRILFVALFSLFFYYESSGEYVLILLFSATMDYCIGRAMGASEDPRARKRLVTLSILVNLGLLSYFKYFYFILDLGQELLSYLGWASAPLVPLEARDYFIPAGISFYTFQTLSYTVDIYRGEIKPLKRWIDYLFYLSFFPQLVAGPIVRARDFIPQIYRRPQLLKAEYGEALTLILSGLIKKAIIGDFIGTNFVDQIFAEPTRFTGVENLFAVYGYAMQIYCDFSGYSDMAIGIALLLGFRFNINFDSPYQSGSITEFWRRWHISLSTWLRDYLYIPLGGNRKGAVRTYVNLIVTMLLGGLWHGAAMRFVLWGAIHGVALALHKLYVQLTSWMGLRRKQPWRIQRILGGVITFHLVCFAWIFFRADSMESALGVIGQIKDHFSPEIFDQFVLGYWRPLAMLAVGYLLHFTSRRQELALRQWITESGFLVQLLLFVGVIFLLIQIRSADAQPFIYFNF